MDSHVSGVAPWWNPAYLTWRRPPIRISLGMGGGERKHLLPAAPLVSSGNPAHLQGHPQGCGAWSKEGPRFQTD